VTVIVSPGAAVYLDRLRVDAADTGVARPTRALTERTIARIAVATVLAWVRGTMVFLLPYSTWSGNSDIK
jgi:hypothetical protein